MKQTQLSVSAGILWLGYLSIGLFFLFYRLGELPIFLWDESLFAMRAFYMAEFGSYIPNFDFFPGISSYRNVKPPLGTWLQGLSFSIFGYTEWALRFPIALLSLVTLATLAWISKIWYRVLWPGMLAGLILLSSSGYLTKHVARTGDHDAIIALFELLLFFAFFQFSNALSNPKKRNYYLVLLATFTILAFLTKSIVAFFFFPAFVVYLLLKGQLLQVLKVREVYLAAAAVVGAILVYYGIQELLFPGFLSMARESVLERYVETQFNLRRPFWIYFQEFVYPRFWPWILFFPLNLVLAIRLRNSLFRDLSLLSWLSIIIFLSIITGSQTKLEWYDASVYPIAALLVGVTFYQLLNWKDFLWYQSLLVLSILVMLGTSLYGTYDRLKTQQMDNPDEQFVYLMNAIAERHPDLKQYTIYCHEYNGHVAFYTQVYNQYKGYDIGVKVYWTQFPSEVGEYMMTCIQEKTDALQKAFETEIVEDHGACKLFRLTQKK